MTTTSPGWYDDGHGSTRWWDGANWTERVLTQDANEPVAESVVVTAPSSPIERATTATASLYTAAPATPGAAPPSPGGTPYSRGRAQAHDTHSGGYVIAHPSQGLAPAVTATESRRSRAWVVWVLLAVVLLGAGILNANLPTLLGAGTGSVDVGTAANRRRARRASRLRTRRARSRPPADRPQATRKQR